MRDAARAHALLRPHSAMWLVRPCARRNFMHTSRSAHSRAPSVTMSPSDSPEPAKSNANTLMPLRSSAYAAGLASILPPALPWQ